MAKLNKEPDGRGVQEVQFTQAPSLGITEKGAGALPSQEKENAREGGNDDDEDEDDDEDDSDYGDKHKEIPTMTATTTI